MSFSFTANDQRELANSVPVDLKQASFPQYGRYLDDFNPGEVFAHPRGFTFTRSAMIAFSRTFLQANPLYLNVEYARALGFGDLPASPQMVFNVVLSLGVQNDSEKAMANLGYYQVQFLRPVYPNDTLTAMTQVVERKERGEDKPGIVKIRTLGLNQDGQVVLQYERKIMVPWRGNRPGTSQPKAESVQFPWVERASIELPLAASGSHEQLTGETYYEDFSVGDIIVHPNGRTITDEHLALTYLTGNTHPLHFDSVYSQGLNGKMSGTPIVYGGLVFAWLDGLASRDIGENALWELGFTEGYHTQPAVSGDTVYAISRILAKEDLDDSNGIHAGIVTAQLIGVKNISGKNALESFGEGLFLKENNKKKLGKDKIPQKIFEIERRLLLLKRPL